MMPRGPLARHEDRGRLDAYLGHGAVWAVLRRPSVRPRHGGDRPGAAPSSPQLGGPQRQGPHGPGPGASHRAAAHIRRHLSRGAKCAHGSQMRTDAQGCADARERDEAFDQSGPLGLLRRSLPRGDGLRGASKRACSACSVCNSSARRTGFDGTTSAWRPEPWPCFAVHRSQNREVGLSTPAASDWLGSWTWSCFMRYASVRFPGSGSSGCRRRLRNV